MFFYLSYVTNSFFLMQFFSVNLLFNIFNFEMFIVTHNGVITDIETIIINNNYNNNLRMITNFRNSNANVNLDILEYSTDTSSETDGERKEEEKVDTVYNID